MHLVPFQACNPRLRCRAYRTLGFEPMSRKNQTHINAKIGRLQAFTAIAVYYRGRDLGTRVLQAAGFGLLSTDRLCNEESSSRDVRCGRRFA